MLCHGAPRLGIVMRTVDACDVHAPFHQLANQVAVGRSRGGQCDHDAGYAIDRLRAQQLLSSVAEQFGAVIGAGAGQRRPLPGVTEHGTDRRPHQEQGGLDMGLAAAQRGQPVGGEPGLHVTQITLPNCPIVHHVPGT